MTKKDLENTVQLSKFLLSEIDKTVNIKNQLAEVFLSNVNLPQEHNQNSNSICIHQNMTTANFTETSQMNTMIMNEQHESFSDVMMLKLLKHEKDVRKPRQKVRYAAVRIDEE